MITTFRRRLALLGIVAAMVPLVATACGGDGSSTTATPTAAGTAAASATKGGMPTNPGKDDKATLTGAGATFPAPIYQAWFDDYNKNVAKGVRINYQSIGSGGGVQQFTQKTVDFGASDAALSDDEMSKAPDVQHIPMVLGSVVVTYNLNGVSKPLRFDGETLARIYLGDIKRWDDPALKALNPGVTLPGADIQVVYRSDGSGTSFVWTDYLSKVSADWKTKVGTSKNPQWAVGQGGKGNEGVTNVVKQTPNAIGYVELNYAIANKLPFGDIKNKAGQFVTPSIASTSAAAAGVQLPADYRISIVNAEGASAYPIASFTYLLVYKASGKCSQQTPLANFLWWAFNDPAAAETAKQLDYAPIPAAALPQIQATIKSLKCDDGAKTSLSGG